MNIAVPQSKAGRKPPFILILVAGTALGIAGAFGIWEVNQPSSGSGSVAVSSALAKYEYVGQDTRTLVLYLVDSPEQTEMVRLGEQEAANERASAGMSDGNYTTMILSVTTPEEEANLSEVLEAWSTAPGGVRLIDYRSR
ncbi:MAG TPA: hypothetical protein VJB57_02935 [Dehalococcoidia bacterium]|nr:hypothetical protein [Dehalococcoidia bacterium]